MQIDLNISGGFSLEVDETIGEKEQAELINRIKGEVNGALSRVAYANDLSFTGVELNEDN